VKISFEQLDVWKKSCRLAVAIYDVIDNSKDYGFVGQITRSAVSVPSNIAEGSERQTTKEFVQFLYIAKGSNAELRTQLYLAGKIGIIPSEMVTKLVRDAKEISSMLQGLINSLNSPAS